MALRKITKLESILLTKLDSLVIKNFENFATKVDKSKIEEDKCPSRACKEGKKSKKKKSFWNIFGAKPKKEAKKPEEKPPKETCRKEIARQIHRPDPDLSEFGGRPFRTCGSAYIIQKDYVHKEDLVIEPEEKVLEKIEQHPDLKNVVDPMPPFESVEQRLLDLCEKKLHPLYKRYMSLPKRITKLSVPRFSYQSRSGPVNAEDIPAHLKLNKECLDRKNIFSEFKRVEPPRQLLAKMVEMKMNEKPTLERKKREQNKVKAIDASKILEKKCGHY